MGTKEKKKKTVFAPLSQEEWNVRYDILNHSLWIIWKCMLVLDVIWYVTLLINGNGSWLELLGKMLIAPVIFFVLAFTFEVYNENHRMPLNDYVVLLILNLAMALVLYGDRWTHSLQMICALPIVFGLIIQNEKLIFAQVGVSITMMAAYYIIISLNPDPFLKDHSLLNMTGVIFNIVVITQVIVQIRKYTQMLDTQTTIDSLTRLHNHESFYEELDMKLAEYEAGQPLSILIADIDNFKKVNDTFGHAYGDKVLKVLAEIFSAEQSNKCFVARYGGEEFAMIMEMNQSDAITKAQKVRKLFEEQKIPTEDGTVNSFTVSVGVAEYVTDFKTSSQFFEKADEALYKAKAGGKNRVCI